MADDATYPKYHTVDGFILPKAFTAENFRSGLRYMPKDDDVFIVTFPKNGTTWVQTIVFLMYQDGSPPLNRKELNETSPFLELVGKEVVENRPLPGTIKAHLPYHLTPKSDKAKYIFVLRNPKDTVVSFFHHTKNRLYGFSNGNFDTYFDVFMNGANDVGDYFHFILSWYEHRHDPNVLLVYYEDLKKDVRREILRLANFIDPEIGCKIENNPDIMERVVENSSFQAMKVIIDGLGSPTKLKKRDPTDETEENKDFIRKGIVGDWRNTFSREQNERMNQKIEQELKGTEMYTFWKDGGYL